MVLVCAIARVKREWVQGKSCKERVIVMRQLELSRFAALAKGSDHAFFLTPRSFTATTTVEPSRSATTTPCYVPVLFVALMRGFDQYLPPVEKAPSSCASGSSWAISGRGRVLGSCGQVRPRRTTVLRRARKGTETSIRFAECARQGT